MALILLQMHQRAKQKWHTLSRTQQNNLPPPADSPSTS